MVSRRDFLKSIGAAIFFPCTSISMASVPDGVDIIPEDESVDNLVQYGNFPRNLWITRGKETYLFDAYTSEGYSTLSWLARDIRAGNVVGTPDARLVRQTIWVQDVLKKLGYKRPLVLTSGLRTPYTNHTTEDAAKASRHLPDKRMTFQAFDFETPGIPSSVLARVALAARDGGVGFYGDKGHVHIDSGPIRFWRGRHV